MATPHLSPSRRSETSYLAFAIIPLVLVFGLLAYGATQQWAAHRYVQAQLASRPAHVNAYDTSVLRARRRDRLSPSLDAEWRELNEAISFLGNKYESAFHVLDPMEELVPSSERWSAEQLAVDYHREAAPLIERMRVLVDSVRKARGDDEGYAFLITHDTYHWHTGEILRNEFAMAYHDGDSARAADMLELEVDVVRTMVGLANAAPPFDIIHRSLEHDFWKAED